MAIDYNSYAGATPNDYYRDLAQAFIDDSWVNTAAKTPENGGEILEQNGIGSSDYTSIEAWVKTTVGDVTSGMRDSGDFIKIYFRDINHSVPRGLMYKFHNSWWICNEFGHFGGIAEDAGLRRCNNFLRMIDPENGAVFTIPCVVEYDMSSPSTQVSRYIITPNNHAVVMCQGNADTLRLFKTNTRFILSGRPFKLTGLQNALNLDLETAYDTLLYLDLYLDEIHDGDDLTNSIADNGEYGYAVSINADDFTATTGANGMITADVTLNGKEVDRELVWISSNSNIVSIDGDGKYAILGKSGESAVITVSLKDNVQAFDVVMITIADEEAPTPTVYIDPAFDKIREYQTVDFNVYASYGGVEYAPAVVELSLDANKTVMSNDYLTIKQTDIGYTISCSKRSKEAQALYVHVSNQTPAFEASAQFAIEAVSMMG